MRIVTVIAGVVLLSGACLALAAVGTQPMPEKPIVMPGVSDGLTLPECYQLALKRSEVVSIKMELLKEAEGQMLQALSTALPKVAFNYSQKWQDVRPNDTFGGYLPEARFTLTQPLFSGFKEFAAIRASNAAGKQRSEEIRRAKQLLLGDVADAFYLYLGYQESLAVQEKISRILEERVAELRQRQQLGKSRASEVSSAEAKLYSADFNTEVVRGQMQAAAKLLEFLIGRPFDRLSSGDIPAEWPSIADLSGTVERRPDVAAARYNLEVFKKNVTVVRSAFLPAVSLSANSYTKRSDLNEGNDWDATVNVSVPLFSGMDDAGKVNAARSQKDQADLKLSQVRRSARLEIENAEIRLESAQKKLAALLKAVEAADKNYELQRQDFQRNLVNNLEVLQALQEFNLILVEQASARAELGRAWWAYQVAVGEDLP